MTAARITDPAAAGPAPERSQCDRPADRNAYRRLHDLADRLQLSLAYVDRATIEVHLERDLTTDEWRSLRSEFRAMDFDDHVGDQGAVRTRWIDTICAAGRRRRRRRDRSRILMSVTRTCPTCGFAGTYATDRVADYHHGNHSCARHLRLAERARRRAERAAGGPRRNCRHERTHHLHGTRAAYVKDRCRCKRCRRANTADSRTSHRERTYGRWEPYVDAGPARAHILALREAGFGLRRIAQLAGVSTTTLRAIIDPVPTATIPAPRSDPRPPRRSWPSGTNAPPAPGTPPSTPSAPAAACRPSSRSAGASRSSRRTSAAPRPTSPARWAGSGLPPAPLTRSASSTTSCGTSARRKTPAPPARPPTPPAPWPRRTAGCRRWPGTTSTPTPTRIAQQPDHLPADVEDLDEIAIERAVIGDSIRLEQLTPAEQEEVVRRLTERGKSIRHIAGQLGTTKRTVSRRRRSAASAA